MRQPTRRALRVRGTSATGTRPASRNEAPRPSEACGDADPDEPPSLAPSALAAPAASARPRAAVTLRLAERAERFPVSKASRAFYRRYFPGTGPEQWSDWRWQLTHRIRSLADLERIFVLSEDERAAAADRGEALPVGITPYYAALMDREDTCDPLRRTHIGVGAEQVYTPGEDSDPLAEDATTVVEGLVHRYPDRVLFLATGFCSTYCRYCTRSRMVGGGGSYTFGTERWEAALAYLREHREVRDVLISGGDPLTMPDDRLDWLLSRLREIEHIEFLRMGSKVPVVMPQRITRSLVRMLRRHGPWMSIHFTHPCELTPEVTEATARLADAGIPLGSQTVLLAGINDEVETMKALVHGLLKRRVRPYYLYQCDPIRGSAHFRTPVEKGLEIIRGLRGYTSGYAVPTFVIDAPGGGGKIPLIPDYVAGRDGDDLLLTNYAGRMYRYPDPGGSVGRLDPSAAGGEARVFGPEAASFELPAAAGEAPAFGQGAAPFAPASLAGGETSCT